MPQQAESLTEDLKIYEVLSKDYLIDHPMCECCGRRFSDDIHHKKGRGIYLNVVEFFLAVCRICHDYIEDHPKWAKANGYSLSRLSKNEDMPIKNRYFLGIPQGDPAAGNPVMITGISDIDANGYCVSTSNKVDQLPPGGIDAKTFSELTAGLLNAFYNQLDVSEWPVDKVIKLGQKPEESGIPDEGNSELPFKNE